jgi:hypothetical protein
MSFALQTTAFSYCYLSDLLEVANLKNGCKALYNLVVGCPEADLTLLATALLLPLSRDISSLPLHPVIE